MQAAIDRVMQTYTMIVNLSADQETITRRKVTEFLAGRSEVDERVLAIDGLRLGLNHERYI
jgi:hypothetical protein